MVTQPTQNDRPAALETPLGPDRLLLSAATIREALSEPFSMEITAYSLDPALDFESLLGQAVSVRIALPDGGQRVFHGHVFEISQQEPEGDFNTYTLTVRPWLWFLTRTSDCRIFQNKTIPEIVEAVFREHGFSDFEERLNDDYEPWEYCAQYRETDFNFVNRLLEQEGIYYFFRHEHDRHVLVLADAPSSHEAIPGAERLRYQVAKGAYLDEPHVYRWDLHKSLQSGAVVLNDYDFRKPRADLKATVRQPRSHAGADYEIYDYPGEYTDPGRGDFYARTRMEALSSHYERMEGASDCAALYTGGLFALEDHPRRDQNRRYLLLEVHHQITQGGYRSEEVVFEYGNHFTVIDAETPFRPDPRTPKPMIRGPQTALVVGPAGEEIHTDEYGRVKLQFHWDRYGKRDENSSCWVRVAQVWAGKNWGGIHIPRIGQEVIVEFLEGDPDQPIITGRVYNAEQMPPYDLPAHKTRSGIKSRSSKGGSPANFNEIRFEDKKGQEEILIHAERNHRIEVEKDESHWVGGDREKTIDGDETTTVKGDRNETVKKNESVVIEQTRTTEVTLTHTFRVGTDETYEIYGNRNTTVGAMDTHEVYGGRKETIHTLWNQTINGPWGQTINGAWTQNIHGPWSQTVNGSVALNATGPFQISAPGGVKIVDSSATWLESVFRHFTSFDYGVTGMKLESTISKLEHTGMVASKTNLTLDSPTTKVQKAVVLEALSSTTGLEMDTLKILL